MVFKADSAGALIDIGAKAAAVLPLQEASLLKLRTFEDAGLQPGMQEEFSIVGEDETHDRYILSLRKAQQDFAWERCRQILADDAVVRCKVSSHFPGNNSIGRGLEKPGCSLQTRLVAVTGSLANARLLCGRSARKQRWPSIALVPRPGVIQGVAAAGRSFVLWPFEPSCAFVPCRFLP